MNKYMTIILCFFVFSCHSGNKKFDIPQIQAPYLPVSGTFSGKPVPHSPDPLVACVTFQCNQPVRIRINQVRGSNAALSGVFFD